MKVKELVERLNKLNQNAEIEIDIKSIEEEHVIKDIYEFDGRIFIRIIENEKIKNEE